jgi:hypothetical protein
VSTQTTTACDFCNKVKGETNHWFLAVISLKGNFSVLKSWITRQGKENKDACGEECVHKALSRFLATGTLEERKEAA